MSPMIESLESRSLFDAGVPAFAHVVLVMEENHGYGEIVGNAAAPYINSLANGGALLPEMHGVTQSSEPNYLALFSGSTEGVTDDAAHTFDAPNLGAQ